MLYYPFSDPHVILKYDYHLPLRPKGSQHLVYLKRYCWWQSWLYPIPAASALWPLCLWFPLVPQALCPKALEIDIQC